MEDLITQLQELFFKPSLWARYGSRIVYEGLVTTLELVGISFFLGAILGIFIALAYLSPSRILRWSARFYIYFFRGSPLLAQLYLFYYGLGSFKPFWDSLSLWWFFGNAWYCCLTIFTLNTAAYQAEIFRGSLMSVPLGQREAAHALSLDKNIAFRRIIMPQALMMALRPLGNEFILLIKSSALASLITIFDLMGMTRLAYSRSYNFQVYLWAAVFYLVIVEVARRVIGLIERRLTRHMQPWTA